MKRLRGFAALILIGALCLGSASAEMFFNGKVTGARRFLYRRRLAAW